MASAGRPTASVHGPDDMPQYVQAVQAAAPVAGQVIALSDRGVVTPLRFAAGFVSINPDEPHGALCYFQVLPCGT